MKAVVSSDKRGEVLSQIDSPLTDPELPYRESLFACSSCFLGKRLLGLRAQPEFPIAKYVAVAKTSESDELYIVRKQHRRRKRYTVGIMTTDNRFYYNTIATVQMAFTRKSIPLLFNVFLRGYNYNMLTRINFTRNIFNLREPVELMFSVATALIGISISRTDFMDKISTINKTFDCVKAPGKGSIDPRRHVKEIIGRLYEDGMFSFAGKYPYLIERIEMYLADKLPLSCIKGEIEPLVGMLEMYAKDLNPMGKIREKKLNEFMRTRYLTEKEAMIRTLSQDLDLGDTIETE